MPRGKAGIRRLISERDLVILGIIVNNKGPINSKAITNEIFLKEKVILNIDLVWQSVNNFNKAGIKIERVNKTENNNYGYILRSK